MLCCVMLCYVMLCYVRSGILALGSGGLGCGLWGRGLWDSATLGSGLWLALKNWSTWLPERPKMASECSWGGLEASQRALGALLRTPGIHLRGLGSPLGPLWGRLGAPGVSLGSFLEALRVPGGTFLCGFVVQGSLRSANNEMLEFDDPLEGVAMSARAWGLQNEVKKQPRG